MRHLRAGLAILSPGVSRDDQPSGRTKWRRPRSETRSRQIAQDAAWRADWRTLPKVQRLLGAPPPLMGETEKEKELRANPRARIKTGAISLGCLTIEYETPRVSAKQGWRRGRDSNPRYSCPYAAFRVRCFQPLSHLSVAANPRKRIANALCSQTPTARQESAPSLVQARHELLDDIDRRP